MNGLFAATVAIFQVIIGISLQIKSAENIKQFDCRWFKYDFEECIFFERSIKIEHKAQRDLRIAR